MAQDHSHTSMPTVFEDAVSGTTGIGDLLRSEREKKGFSYSQVSQRTCLRKPFLEALENEDWDRLPQPVFVKGFIRSYASALGMDPERILALYPTESSHVLSPPTTQKNFGEPLAKKTKSLFIVVGLACAAVTGYVVHKHGAHVASVFHSQEFLSSAQSPSSQRVGSETRRPSATTGIDSKEMQPASAPVTIPESGAPSPASPVSPPEDTSHLVADSGARPSTRSPTPPVDAAPLTVDSPWILRGSVLERTWVKITVDDQAPKEYIFSAGSHPRWEAQDSFHLVIGNAGGMKLSLNGRSVGDLGNTGQVIRLRLP